MIVWITHVKVGHRQTPIKQKAQPCVGLFALWNLIYDLLEALKTNSLNELVSAETHIGIIDVVAKVGHPSTGSGQASDSLQTTKPSSRAYSAHILPLIPR